MVTVTLSRRSKFAPAPVRVLPLNPHRLRIAAVLFALAAAAALLTGCSADSGTSEAREGISALRGLALATRPSSNFASDPARPQRHARQAHLPAIHLPTNLQRHQLGLIN